MARARQEEAQLLERVARYREEYCAGRVAALNEERQRRHTNGEVYIAGSWVRGADADRVVRALQRHERLAFVEIVFVLVVLVAIALILWLIFVVVLLP